MGQSGPYMVGSIESGLRHLLVHEIHGLLGSTERSIWDPVSCMDRDSHEIAFDFLNLHRNGGAPKVGGAVTQETIDCE
jgi:hypothetical protein